MTDNLIDPNADHGNNQDNQNVNDPLEFLIGPGGKFHRENRDEALKELAKSKIEADRFIQFKNREYDVLRDDYMNLREEHQSRAKLEELYDLLKNNQTLANSEHTPNANEVNINQPAFKPEDIENLVSTKLQQHEVERQHRQNIENLRNKLKDRYGENYNSVLNQNLQQLGLDVDTFNQLAREKPAFIERALGLDQQQHRDTFQAPPQNQQRFAPTGGQKRTWSYYEKMRRENPNLYYSGKIQTQMHKDRAELGTAFEDGDWASL